MLPSLSVELTRAPCGLRVSVDAGPISQGFELLEVALDEVDRLAQDLRFLLERANLFGEIGLETADEIERLALLLFDLITPRSLKDLLRRLPEGSAVTLRLDESLQHIPWEFMHTGRDFLARQLSIGRVVARYGIEPPPTRRALAGGAKRALVIADPRADLPAGAAEGLSLCDLLRQREGLEVAYKAHPVSRADVREQLREHDIIHFAGHVEWDTPSGGWALCDGHFGAADVDQLAGGRPMPALVFANACASAAARGGVDHMARSLLSAGALNVIGTLWDIPDALGGVFAHSLYDDLLRGVTVGEALRRARIELAYHHGEGAMLWGSYVLYGPPEQRYFEPPRAAAGDDGALLDPLFAAPEQRARQAPPLTARVGGDGSAWAVRRVAAQALVGDWGLLGERTARVARAATWGVVACAGLMAALALALWLAQPKRSVARPSAAEMEAAAMALVEQRHAADPQLAASPVVVAPLPEADLTVVAQARDLAGQPHALPLAPGDGLAPGARLRVVVDPHHSAYTSLLYVRHDGLVQVLPLEGEETAYLRAHQVVALPGSDRWFSADHAPGPAAVVLLQSREPITGLQGAVRDLGAVLRGVGRVGALLGSGGGLRALPLAAMEARLLEEVDTVTTFELDLLEAAPAAP